MTVHASTPQRNRPPNRRNSELLDTIFRGCRYTISISRFANGALAEVFVDPARAGSNSAADANDAAILISLSLQHGVPLEALRHSISRVEGGKPASIVGRLLDTLAEEEGRSGDCNPWP